MDILKWVCCQGPKRKPGDCSLEGENGTIRNIQVVQQGYVTVKYKAIGNGNWNSRWENRFIANKDIRTRRIRVIQAEA